MPAPILRSIRCVSNDPLRIEVLDQRQLPFATRWASLTNCADVVRAISEMWVRGAPLIGVTAAYGYCFAVIESMSQTKSQQAHKAAIEKLREARPTAVNLQWALSHMEAGDPIEKPAAARILALLERATALVEADAAVCRAIGQHGLPLLEEIHATKGEPVNILTHCNAGWLACIEWGTATAPIYLAHEKGIPVHVWVDETRPRNQGGKLTAWELDQAGVPHTVITDNAGGHLMQHGQVDICFVGTDRTTLQGDVANKIGTYLKALAARDNGIPFWVAAPSSSIDFSLREGLREIPIEVRSEREVTHLTGWNTDTQSIEEIRLVPERSAALNPGFDVTPARLVTGLITEVGRCAASTSGLAGLFPEKFA